MVAWSEVLGAVQTALSGPAENGRPALDAAWARTGPTDAAQRCVLAHYLADVAEELADEVQWDEIALATHAQVAEGELAAIGIPTTRALLPSLHLNLGDGYHRMGRAAAAREQLAAAQAAIDALDDDGYGQLIRSGLERLAAQLDEDTSGSDQTRGPALAVRETGERDA